MGNTINYDESGILSHGAEVSIAFDYIKKIDEDITENLKSILDEGVWKSDTRDTLDSKVIKLYNNFDAENAHFDNVKEFLDMVVSNYVSSDNDNTTLMKKNISGGETTV